MNNQPTIVYLSGHGETGRNPEEILPYVYLMLSFHDIYFKKTQAPKRLLLLKETNANRTNRTAQRS